MSTRNQRLTSFLTAVVMALPMSVFAEKSSRPRTDLDRIAEELGIRREAPKPIIERAPRVPRGSVVSVEALVEAMNRERSRHGLGPLRLNTRLSQAAGDRVDDMFDKRYFDHVSPDGIDPFVWADKRGYDYRAIGENLATGYRSSQLVVDGWMRSPGHRANILGKSFDEVGIAVADGSPLRGFAGPLVVAMYGAR